MAKDTFYSHQLQLPLTGSSPKIEPSRNRSPETFFSVDGMPVVRNEYTGLWIRVQHRFGPRMMEWFMSVHMLGWALVLFYVDGLFEREAYKQFALLFNDQAFLGWILGLVAVGRLAGLIINGARPTVTPAIRQWSAAIGFLVWTGISYCFFMSGLLGVWITTYPLAALAELVNFYRAAHDHGEAHGRVDK